MPYTLLVSLPWCGMLLQLLFPVNWLIKHPTPVQSMV
jgi:hypothetical protein